MCLVIGGDDVDGGDSVDVGAVITQWLVMEVAMTTQCSVMEVAHWLVIVLRLVALLKMLSGMTLMHTFPFDRWVFI
jgi:hypothetical protein